MLQAIRDRVTGWIAWVIVGLIILTFALWGVDSYLKEDVSTYAAKVDGVEISEATLGRAMQRQRVQMQRALGKEFDPSMIDEKRLRSSVLDNLIQKQLLIEMANKTGIVVSDQLLAARIQSIPDLQVDGAFSMERYESLLRQQGMTPIGFEMDLRLDLLSNQILNGIAGTLGVSDAELKRVYALQAQQRTVEYLRISADKLSNRIKLEEADVAAYFEAHKDEFREPEQVKLEYIELKRDGIATEIPVDEAAVHAYYEQHITQYGTEERRRARHILIQVEAAADETAQAAARTKAEQALQRIRNGEDFGKVAGELSDDPGSAAQGGDLGFFTKGMMVPEFDAAVFSLPKGEVSDLVQSPFGFHIIEVTDIEPGKAKPLSEVHDQIVAELRAGQVEDLFLDRAEILANTSYENPGTLGVAAEALGLKVQESGWISRDGGEGIGVFPPAVIAAFSEDVLDGGNNSDPVEVQPGHLVVLRILDHKPARFQDLAVVRDVVESALRAQRARELAAEQGQVLLKKLAAGDPMASLADADTIEYLSPGNINRTVQDIPASIVAEAFRMPHPQGDQPATAGIVLPDGDYAVIAVAAVTDGDPAKMTDAERQQVRQVILRVNGAAEANALIDYLKSQADIDIPRDEQN